MKTKILFLIFTFGIIVNAFSQRPTMELVFSANNNGQYVTLDSIFIENLIMSGDTTLYFPDTILILEYITSISNNQILAKKGFSITQNYPNPFNGKTTFNLYLPEKEHIKIIVLNILGSELAYYNKVLNQGIHSFNLNCGNEETYLLTIIGEQDRKTIKMINSNTNSESNSECILTYNSYDNRNYTFKATTSVTSNFIFNLGDQLRYIGYAKTIDLINGSDTIEDAPQNSEFYEFEIESLYILPTVTTDNANNMTQTTATCGGNVISDGGSPVISKGVCWSINNNPTLSDSYTIDGSGVGAFTSNLTGLIGNTQYYVRAYATNIVGTEYGNEITFSTLPILPSVTTDVASNITQTTAISGGNVITNGGTPVSFRGVCWSISANPTISDSTTIDGSGTGEFISNITGLIGNTQYYVRAYATSDIGTAYGNEISFTTSYSWMCGDPISYSDKNYNTVLIGSQCWFKENLNIGTLIPLTTDQLDNGIIERYCYNEDTNYCNIYGGLYQWDEVMQYVTTEGAQGICPSGWHIPTDNEWKILEGYTDTQYGIGDPIWDTYGWRGFDTGQRLKTTTEWTSNTGTDFFDFSALPGGFSSWLFNGLGYYGFWWVSTESNSDNSINYMLQDTYNNSNRGMIYKSDGLSVKCLKDN